ncbi:Cyanate hydratase [Coemansia javaensis]|uniref:Cyanate hydratase n=1 Tax=Coemansia javaensis TaxID=2761396 RepID=A0A9W8HAJ8_9FUNG|nr:Cyanate hydratase [Coemansia javaensis]
MNTDGLPPACARLLHEKARRRLSFAHIADKLGHDEVWTAALFYGRAAPSHRDVAQLASLLGLSAETLEDDFRTAGPPLREAAPAGATTNPVVGPFCDALVVYAPAVHSVIVERLGDGAVCAPTMKVRVEKAHRPAGSPGAAGEVRLVLEAKYIGYQSW